MKTMPIAILSVLMATLAGCGGADNKYDASGTFESTEVIVSSEATGRILSFDSGEGQTLKAGEGVVRIDDLQLTLKRKQLLANIKGVESRRPDIAVQLAATRQQIMTAKTERSRIEKLLQADAANQKQLDDVNSQIATLEKQLAAQRLLLENSSRGVTEESSALDIQIAQIDDQISKCVVESPIDGTVLVKYAEKGELAVAGKALFKIADMNAMFLRAYITSAQLTKVKLGQDVTVFSDFGGKDFRSGKDFRTYPGKVVWISDKSEFTPKTIQTRDERDNLVYAVKIAVVNDGYLKIGMYGSVKIENE